MGILEDLDAMFRNLGRGPSGGNTVGVHGLQRPMPLGPTYEQWFREKDAGKLAPVR